MTIKDYLPIITFILGLIAAALFAQWTRSGMYDIALRSGAFDKPEPSLYFGNYKLNPGSVIRIIYGYKFEEERVPIIAIMPLHIINNGGKTLEDAAILIRHQQFPFKQFNTIVQETDYQINGDGITRNTRSDGQFGTATWSIKAINPKMLLEIKEPLRIVDMKKPVVITFREGNKWYHLSYESLKLLITITAKDTQPQDYNISIQSMKSSNKDELEKKYKSKIADRSRKIRESLPYLKYIKLYFSQSKIDDILIYLDKDNNFYQTIVSYYPFSIWS